MPVQIAEIRQAVRAAGAAGRPVAVHASLRSFGRVDGGAGAIVEAFLAAEFSQAERHLRRLAKVASLEK